MQFLLFLLSNTLFLQDTNAIQQYFSSDKRPTLWKALPAIEWLQTLWEAKAANEKYAMHKNTIQDGIAKLCKYYSRFDDKPAYILALGKQIHSFFSLACLTIHKCYIRTTS